MQVETFDEKGALLLHDLRPSLLSNGVLIDRGYIQATSTTIPATSTWTSVNNSTITFTTLGGDVYIDAGGWIYLNSSATASNFLVEILLDGTTSYPLGYVHRNVAPSSNRIRNFTNFVKITGLSAGSHTVVLRGWNLTGSSPGLIADASDRPARLRVTEVVTENILPEEMRQSKLWTPNGVTESVSVDSGGYVSLPLHPRVEASVSGTLSNVTGDNSTYTVVFNSEAVDIGGNYDHTTGIFTAPVDGLYTVQAYFQGSGLGSFARCFSVLSSNLNNYTFDYLDADQVVTSTLYGFRIAATIRLLSGHTCDVQFNVNGGARTVDVTSGWLRINLVRAI